MHVVKLIKTKIVRISQPGNTNLERVNEEGRPFLVRTGFIGECFAMFLPGKRQESPRSHGPNLASIRDDRREDQSAGWLRRGLDERYRPERKSANRVCQCPL